MRNGPIVLVAIVLAGISPAVHARQHWVPAVAHSTGAAGSVWRSDVSVLNLCPVATTVELRLHAAGGVATASFEVAAGSQQVFQDVVAQLTSDDAVGSLEVLSDQELVITSRTYNVTDDGTYGQSLDGVRDPDGIDAGETAYLPQLQQTQSFRTNIGVLNMSGDPATVTVTLSDQSGAEVGSFGLTVPARELLQDNAPYSHRYGRTDVVAGLAKVTVESGNNLWFYASVVDNRTGDPTTVAMRTFGSSCDFRQARDRFFSLEQVHEIAIEVDTEGVDSLLAAPQSYVHAAVSVDSQPFADVGVRLKGGAGSFIPLDGAYPPISGDGNCKPGKSAFIVDFNRYEPGCQFFGLEKLTLNNMVQDDSGIHEFLGYALFRAGEVPASRAGYATVSFNGEDKGIYLALESPDNDDLLDEWLGTNDVNLYEGEYGADLSRHMVPWFDQDHGSDDSRQDLYELVAALDAMTPADDAAQVLDQHLALDRYLAFAATELFLGHWDGYAWSANNYFLLHDLEAEQWLFVPWGIDQLFEDPMGPYAGVMRAPGPSWEGFGGRIHALCFSSAACRSRLQQAFSEVLDRADAIDLAGLPAEARGLVEPLLLAEATAYGDPQVTLDAYSQVDWYIGSRRQAVERWLPCLAGETVDNDGDTFDACTADCNDAATSIHPGAEEHCDLVDEDCNDVIDDPASCPRCLDEVAPDGSTYALCFDRLSWEEARTRCDAAGAELASIHDRATFEHLSYALIERLHVDLAWIGLSDRQTEGTFVWTDGSPLDLELWTSDSPKPQGEVEDCVASAPWGWSDHPCDVRLPFVCKR